MRWQFVDEVLQIEPGVSIKTAKFFSPSLEFFQDHFPARPILPGVFQIECIVAAAARCILPVYPDRRFYLAMVKSAKFRFPVEPPAKCEVHAVVKKNNFPYIEARGWLHANGRLCSEVLITLAANDIPR